MKVCDYKGSEINVDRAGEFHTDPDDANGFHKADTLAEIKKLIDKGGASVKGPDKAFTLSTGWNDEDPPHVEQVRCGAIIKQRYGRHREAWITELQGGSRSKANAEDVYEATPKNLALAEEWCHFKTQERQGREAAAHVVARMIPVEESVPGGQPREKKEE